MPSRSGTIAAITSAKTRLPASSRAAARGVVWSSSSSSSKPSARSSSASVARGRVELFVTNRSEWPGLAEPRDGLGGAGDRLAGDVQDAVDVEENAGHRAGSLFVSRARVSIPLGRDRAPGLAVERARRPARQHGRDAGRGVFDVEASAALTERPEAARRRAGRPGAPRGRPGRAQPGAQPRARGRALVAKLADGAPRRAPARCRPAPTTASRRAPSRGEAPPARDQAKPRGTVDEMSSCRIAPTADAEVVRPLLRGRFGAPTCWHETCTSTQDVAATSPSLPKEPSRCRAPDGGTRPQRAPLGGRSRAPRCSSRCSSDPTVDRPIAAALARCGLAVAGTIEARSRVRRGSSGRTTCSSATARWRGSCSRPRPRSSAGSGSTSTRPRRPCPGNAASGGLAPHSHRAGARPGSAARGAARRPRAALRHLAP